MLLQQPDKILPNPSGRALPNPSGKALPNPSLEGLSFSYGLSVRVVSSGFKQPVPNLSSPRGDRGGGFGEDFWTYFSTYLTSIHNFSAIIP